MFVNRISDARDKVNRPGRTEHVSKMVSLGDPRMVSPKSAFPPVEVSLVLWRWGTASPFCACPVPWLLALGIPGFAFFLFVGLGVMFCSFFSFSFWGGFSFSVFSFSFFWVFSFGCECGSECVVKWRASLTLTSVWEKWVCSVLVLGGHVFTVFVICRDLCVFCYKCVSSFCVKFYKSSDSFLFCACVARECAM